MKIKVSKGVGFWDLQKYPWGGDFKRISEDVELPVVRVVETYGDGKPSQVVAIYEGRQIGLVPHIVYAIVSE